MPVLRPNIHGYNGCKWTCTVEQAVLCISPAHEAKRAVLSTGGSLELGSLHTWGALFRESMSHHPRVLNGYWVNQLFSVKWWGGGDVPTGSKNNGLNQPKAQEPCTMHFTCHKKIVWNHVPCKQTVVTIWTKGTANWVKLWGATVEEIGPTAMLHLMQMRCATCHKSVDRPWRTRPWIHGGTWVCKALWRGAASRCSRWSIASFMLPSVTHPMRL